MNRPRFRIAYILLPIIFYGNYLSASDGLLWGFANNVSAVLTLALLALTTAGIYLIDKKYGDQYYKRYEACSRVNNRRVSVSIIKLIKTLSFYLGFTTLSAAFFIGLFTFRGIYTWWHPFKMLLEGSILWTIYFVAASELRLPHYNKLASQSNTL